MPVSVKIDPFSKQPIDQQLPLRTPQARAMSVLVPEDQSLPEFDWPLYNKAQLAARMGVTPISGTLTRVLNGIRAGSSSGAPHPGLLALGHIKETILDIEGSIEVHYQATRAGVDAYNRYVKENGELPKMRDRELSTNLHQGKGDNHRSKRASS